MTKAEIVANISKNTGLEKSEIQVIVDSFMGEIKSAMSSGNNVFLRGFGSFVVKKRARKTGRNIMKNVSIIIPAHNIPSFKPAKTFAEEVKKRVPINN